ncbi:MAG: DNA-3-methyladenine glycosylase I [Elusimicrobia bacterium]|nr:DNA-3-methyladenine glycosylase I [Elusimicrobiota bacterium]
MKRCGWGEGHADYLAYHDEEWGVPVTDDRKLFEFLILEGAQAGLSWLTILRRREGYRKAFAGFDPEKVARFDERDAARLLRDTGIIRNRLKVRAAIRNARVFLDIQKEFGSFSAYQWRFVGGRPIQNRWKRLSQLPANSRISDAFSKDLKARGMSFVGSTVIYSHMQAVGMVNDHLVGCFRHRAVPRLAARLGS